MALRGLEDVQKSQIKMEFFCGKIIEGDFPASHVSITGG